MAGRKRPIGALLLTPGASATRDHPTLVAIDRAMAPMPVARVDIPHRFRAPKVIASIVDDASAFTAEAHVAPKRLALGGRSMGGRMCSMAVAEGLPAAALVLISYPLHPPGAPEKLRIEHLPAIDVPCLFVSGTRDAFGTPEELEHHTASIPGPVTHHWIEGKDHGMKGADAEVASVVRDWLRSL